MSLIPDRQRVMTITRYPRGLASVAAASLLLMACGSDDSTASPTESAAPDTTATAAVTAEDGDDHDLDHDHEDDHEAEEGQGDIAVELAGNRVVTTYDGGLLVLDGPTLEVVADIAVDGFIRVNPAGDDRHVIVTHGDEFLVLDSGVDVEPHGDHDHYFGEAPLLTDHVFTAPHAGHVTHHHGVTALFADGTGDITLFDPVELITDEVDEAVVTSESAHHGVAVQLADGLMFATVGTEDERTGVRVFDAAGSEIARTDDCPGVHGETLAAPDAAGDVVVAGCQDGAIIWSAGAFTKVDSPDEYGRIGTLKGTETSTIVLGDYKVDPDVDLERPTRVSLVDVDEATMRFVELDSSYSWRSLTRDHDDNAIVLTTDGDLTVIDVITGDIITEIPVVTPWEEPLEWQQPRPAITIDGATAYVTDPATDTIHRVDLDTGTVVASAELPVTPNEITTP